MASVDIDIIHGDHLTKPVSTTIDHSRVRPLPVHYRDLNSVSLTTHNKQPVYLIDSLSQQLAINALTGQRLTIDRAYILQRALDIYNQDGAIQTITRLAAYPNELGGRPSPIWRVTFDDTFSPTLYFSPATGQFIKARSDLWRIFDVMWILHIMDYQAGEDVNNLLLSVAVFVALFAACSGFWLICYSFKQRKQARTSLSFFRTLHKWLALVVGAQILLWIVGGLVFNLLSSDKVNLNHQLINHDNQQFNARKLNISAIMSKSPLASTITIEATPTSPLVTISTQGILKKLSLATLTHSEISEENARRIAQKAYLTDAMINSVLKVAPGHLESRKLNRSLWQINYQDDNNTALYIDAKTGKAVALKDDTWRLKDWFWMLHIMDYSMRSDFNTPLLITAASVASFVALSGLMMLFYVFSRDDFGFKKKLIQYQVSIFSSQQGQQAHRVNGHQALLHALKEQGVELPSGCGGGGTCCQCMVVARQINQPLTTQERTSLSMGEINQGCRLACQLQVNADMNIELSDQVAAQKNINATVLSSEFKTPFIKEIVLRLAPGHGFTFSAGQYVNLDIPSFSTIIKPQLAPIVYRQQWQEQRIINQRVSSSTPITRSYSIASKPDDINTIVFNVKLALPHAGYGLGVASSYLCNLNVGEAISFSGPYGDFVTELDSPKELILIGAGAGMAPLKSHVDTLLSQRTRRDISFWFGARTQPDIFYQNHFEGLARRHHNFNWHVSLSKPIGNDWLGHRGYIQQALFEQHLQSHRRIDNIEFLLCGPAPMMRDVRLRLQRLGVASTAIKCDDFG